MLLHITLWIGCLSVGILLAGWVGYPIWLARRARSTPRLPPTGIPGRTPAVSVLIATREAPSVVLSRVRDILRSDYPSEQLEVIVAVDLRSSYEFEVYRSALKDTAIVVVGDPPGGKAVTLNAAVREARSPCLVFADSAQTFDRFALRRLVAALNEPGVGAVSGNLIFGTEHRAASNDPLRLFWNYELTLRRNEAAVHSLVAVTGAIYGLRRELWEDLASGLICDDLFVPLNVAMAGYRVGWCEDAIANDPRTFTRREEFQRKVRTLTGMLQYCAFYPRALSYRKNPVWIQFVCHKLLRIATPFLFTLAMFCFVFTSATLAPHALQWFAALMVLLVVLVATIWPKRMIAALNAGAWSLALLYAPVIASINAARGNWDVWRQAR